VVKKILTLIYEDGRGNYLFALSTGGFHPFGDGATDIGFVAVPGGAVDVTVSSFKSSEDSVVTFFRSSLKDSQCENRDRMARVELHVSPQLRAEGFYFDG